MTEKNLAEQVEEKSAVYFRIDACPQPVYAEFKKFSREASIEVGLTTHISYSIGLKKLMSIKKKYEELTEIKEEPKAEKPVVFGART